MLKKSATASFPYPASRARSGASAQSGRNVAVDLDQRFEMLPLRADLQRCGLGQYEDADIGDVLPYFERLRIVVTLGFAEENRPELAVEHQRFECLRIGRVGIGHDSLQLVRRRQQGLGFDISGRRGGIGNTRVGLGSSTRHSSPRQSLSGRQTCGISICKTVKKVA